MFDIAFTELLVIGIVALIVIGPERLPKVARTAGQWIGRMNRYVSQVKQDIDRDIRLEELRKMQTEMKDSAQKYEILASETAQGVEGAVQQETASISKVMQAMGATDEGVALREWEKLRETPTESPDGSPLMAETLPQPADAETIEAAPPPVSVAETSPAAPREASA
ncbi:MAG: twin-arginine translocase subunit TatB [Betaproteobacteria bacterium]|nr:twin-arginine translocase subunit TatB [Betaproteobacteria bacterium]